MGFEILRCPAQRGRWPDRGAPSRLAATISIGLAASIVLDYRYERTIVRWTYRSHGRVPAVDFDGIVTDVTGAVGPLAAGSSFTISQRVDESDALTNIFKQPNCLSDVTLSLLLFYYYILDVSQTIIRPRRDIGIYICISARRRFSRPP